MRYGLAVLCTSLLLFCLPSAVMADDGEEPAKNQKGLVGGLLHQVKNTVGETLTSTGDLVEETVKFTGDTVDRTVKYTEETVKSVTTPSGKRPVKEVVENSTNFVGETLESTIPVVEKTTETVQKVTEEAVKVTKPLPNVPVVTPVVDKTTETVTDLTGKVTETADETVGTVVESVSKPLKKPSSEQSPAEDEIPSSSVQGKPNLPTQPSSSVEQPAVKPDEKPQSNVPDKPVISKPVHPEFSESSDETEKNIPAVPLEKPEKIPAVNGTDNVLSGHAYSMDVTELRDYVTDAMTDQVQPLAESFTMETSGQAPLTKELTAQAVPSNVLSPSAVPLKPDYLAVWKPAVEWVTGSSSVSTSLSVSAGGGMSAVPADDWQITVDNIRQKWYTGDIIGTLQWTHAPPGQPPQSAPFLYV